ncbi:MAG: T9SS type A sorting domain-containing protein [Flavobacteriales bacterium]|nr:T9SS type A sorting domain-containing protein [Flavobacteriales bacterium]
MKKIYLLLLGIMLSFGLSAQLNNMGLNDWTAGFGYDDPDGWTTVNQYAAFISVSPSVLKITSNVSEGTAAAEMFTQPCPNCSSFGAPDTLPGALIQQTGYYSNTVTDFVFDYQYEPVNGDWGAAFVELTVWDAVNDTAIVIAEAADTIGATVTTWTTRTIPFVFNSTTLMPDSIKIYFVSSARDLAQDPTFPPVQDGSTLRIDNVKIIDPASASVEEYESPIEVFVYQRIITINAASTSVMPYEIVDLTGKVVMSGKTSSSTTQINAEHLRSGVYLVSVGDQVKKVIME